MMEKEQFVATYAPAASTAGLLFCLNPVVIVAQAAIESGWGESALAKECNNFFGLTGYGVANAYWHGGKSRPGKNDLLFRRYDSLEHSFLDFARLITSAYPSAAAVSYYPAAYAREIAYSRYISEVNGDNRAAYCDRLIRISSFVSPLINKSV